MKKLRHQSLYLTLGLSLLLMTLIAPIAYMGIFPSLLEDFQMSRFQVALLLFVMVVILDFILSWGLWFLWKQSYPMLSIHQGFLRLIYTILLAWIVLGFAQGVEASGEGYQIAWERFHFQFASILTLFGFHLLVLSIILWRERYWKGVLGVFLAVSGLGYSLDGILAGMNIDWGFQFSSVTFVGELLLMVWLLIQVRSFNKIEGVQL